MRTAHRDFAGGHFWFNNVRLEVWKLTSHVEDFGQNRESLGEKTPTKNQSS